MTDRYDIDFSEHFFYDETSPTFLRHKTDKWAGNWLSEFIQPKWHKLFKEIT